MQIGKRITGLTAWAYALAAAHACAAVYVVPEEPQSGAIPALSASPDTQNGIQVLPPNGGNGSGQGLGRRGVAPVIVLPPQSLEGSTLVVPLPHEQAPAVILRDNSIEAVPHVYPSLPGAPKKAPLAPIIAH